MNTIWIGPKDIHIYSREIIGKTLVLIYIKQYDVVSLSVCVFAEILGDDFPWSADRYRLKKSPDSTNRLPENWITVTMLLPYHLILLISNPPPPLELK